MSPINRLPCECSDSEKTSRKQDRAQNEAELWGRTQGVAAERWEMEFKAYRWAGLTINAKARSPASPKVGYCE